MSYFILIYNPFFFNFLLSMFRITMESRHITASGRSGDGKFGSLSIARAKQQPTSAAT